MINYRKANRPDLAVLNVLSKSIDPITLVDIERQVCGGTDWVSIAALGNCTQNLVSDGLATRSTHPRGGSVPVYAITCKGRARLVVADTHSIFHDHLKDEPRHIEEPVVAAVSATVCHAPEVLEDPEPAVALLCVDEDELDAWWAVLDVEAKADVFAQYSLGNNGRNSHVYIEPNEVGAVSVAGPDRRSADDEISEFLRKHHKTITKAMEALVKPPIHYPAQPQPTAPEGAAA